MLTLIRLKCSHSSSDSIVNNDVLSIQWQFDSCCRRSWVWEYMKIFYSIFISYRTVLWPIMDCKIFGWFSSGGSKGSSYKDRIWPCLERNIVVLTEKGIYRTINA